MSTDHKPFNGHTPEERARERYRMPSEENSGFDWYDDECDKVKRKRVGYADCIREEVEPREAELSSLRESLKMCVEALDGLCHGPMPMEEAADMALSALSHVKATHHNL